MPLQPSFQIRAAPSLENVTFSRSRQGGDGGSGKGGVGWGGGGGRQMLKGGGAGRRLQVLRSGKIGGSSRGGREGEKDGMQDFTP